jgi:hypothetical protein
MAPVVDVEWGGGQILIQHDDRLAGSVGVSDFGQNVGIVAGDARDD